MLRGIQKGHLLQEAFPHPTQAELGVPPICSHRNPGISAMTFDTPYWKQLFQCPFFHYTSMQCEGRNCVLDICISLVLSIEDTQ